MKPPRRETIVMSADGISSSNRNKESADDADLQELFDLIATTNKKSNHLKGDLRICPPNPNITTNKSNEVCELLFVSLVVLLAHWLCCR